MISFSNIVHEFNRDAIMYDIMSRGRLNAFNRNKYLLQIPRNIIALISYKIFIKTVINYKQIRCKQPAVQKFLEDENSNYTIISSAPLPL